MTRTHQILTPALALALALSLSWQAPAVADPPSWAPANGERDRGDARWDGHRDDRPNDRDDRPYRRDDRVYRYDEGHRAYRGYRGDNWDNDYGVVREGRCDTNAVLGVVGALTGGIIGHNAAAPRNRGVATVFGAIAGGIIGSAIGNSIDDGDRACIGHSLELAQVGRPVEWRNPHSQVAWRLEPLRDLPNGCREFDLRRDYYSRHGHERVVACRRTRGDWEFQGR